MAKNFKKTAIKKEKNEKIPSFFINLDFNVQKRIVTRIGFC